MKINFGISNKFDDCWVFGAHHDTNLAINHFFALLFAITAVYNFCCLIDNEESTNFSEESINDFISYINQPNSQIINNDNVFILQKLNKKYKIKSLQTETDDYINKHHEELLIQAINDRNNLSLEEERSII